MSRMSDCPFCEWKPADTTFYSAERNNLDVHLATRHRLVPVSVRDNSETVEVLYMKLFTAEELLEQRRRLAGRPALIPEAFPP